MTSEVACRLFVRAGSRLFVKAQGVMQSEIRCYVPKEGDLDNTINLSVSALPLPFSSFTLLMRLLGVQLLENLSRVTG